MTGKALPDQAKFSIITKCSDIGNKYMAQRIKSLFTLGLLNRKKLLDLSKRDKLMAKKR